MIAETTPQAGTRRHLLDVEGLSASGDRAHL